MEGKENNTQTIERQYVDIKEVLRQKSPKLAKFVPGFLLRYFKDHIIHQDEINEVIKLYGDRVGVPFIDGTLDYMKTKINITGIENIPETGRYIIASNHPLGGLDGLALMWAVHKRRPDLIFPVNDILMNIKNLEPLFIPINKHGSNAQNIGIINETFESDRIVCYFPAGLVSRKQKGVIKDLDWQPTFITKAKRFKRDIIPTFISGNNSNFFYNLANLRKKLKIKANIEMLFLVDEFHKQKNREISITFGKPVPYQTFDKRMKKEQWANRMRDFVYTLKENPLAEFKP